MRKIVDHFEEYVLVGILALIVALVFVQVVLRYCFSYAPASIEELCRFLFLWQVWLGASCAVKYRSHLKVEAFICHFSGRTRWTMDFIALGTWFCFSGFLVFYGVDLTTMLFQRHQLATALQIPIAYAYASVPFGAALMALRVLGEIWEKMQHIPGKAMMS